MVLIYHFSCISNRYDEDKVIIFLSTFNTINGPMYASDISNPIKKNNLEIVNE
jgi:hypothetical protein